MNVTSPIDSERIFNDVIAQTSALKVIKNCPKRFSNWDYGLWTLIGFAWGWFVSSSEEAPLILSVASGIAFFLSVAVFRECLRLRRRLDAAIVLLLKYEANSSIKRDA
ncbi:MAG: hypothetical protein HOP25_02895 [Methylotenera sp.]|nr:hypothetical protein [Methylotenera sp.]